MAYEDSDFVATPLILVIDDDRVLTTLFAQLLAATGRVLTTNDGGEGLRLARAELPDLILLDVNMPGQDGFDIISELKADPDVRHIPVMFITGEVLPEIESHCLEAGAADYIAKPVNGRVLQARARTHILLKQQADQLADLSFRDAATGAINLGAFEERLDSECRRATWKHRPISLLILDIDDLESYNRTYGYTAGDDVLARVVALMQAQVNRPGDVVARLAGATFAALLPETDADEAAGLAEKLRAGVEGLGVRHSRSRAADVVTASIGVASPTGPTSAASLRRAGESALRHAKEHGRNQIATSG